MSRLAALTNDGAWLVRSRWMYCLSCWQIVAFREKELFGWYAEGRHCSNQTQQRSTILHTYLHDSLICSLCLYNNNYPIRYNKDFPLVETVWDCWLWSVLLPFHSAVLLLMIQMDSLTPPMTNNNSSLERAADCSVFRRWWSILCWSRNHGLGKWGDTTSPS